MDHDLLPSNLSSQEIVTNTPRPVYVTDHQHRIHELASLAASNNKPLSTHLLRSPKKRPFVHEHDKSCADALSLAISTATEDKPGSHLADDSSVQPFVATTNTSETSSQLPVFETDNQIVNNQEANNVGEQLAPAQHSTNTSANVNSDQDSGNMQTAPASKSPEQISDLYDNLSNHSVSKAKTDGIENVDVEDYAHSLCDMSDYQGSPGHEATNGEDDLTSQHESDDEPPVTKAKPLSAGALKHFVSAKESSPTDDSVKHPG